MFIKYNERNKTINTSNLVTNWTYLWAPQREKPLWATKPKKSIHYKRMWNYKIFVLTKPLQLTHACTKQATHLPATVVALPKPSKNSSTWSHLSEIWWSSIVVDEWLWFTTKTLREKQLKTQKHGFSLLAHEAMGSLLFENNVSTT